MSYPELKSESYSLLGGMNSKASPYNNGPMEFRELTNYQFTQPGAIDKRYGTTLYASGISMLPVTGLYEYNKINGSSYLMKGESDRMYTASPTGQTLIYSYGSTEAMGLFDFSTFVDTLFFTAVPEGLLTPPIAGMRKFNGSSAYLFGLPPGAVIGPTAGWFFNATATAGGSLTSAGVTTIFKVGYGYLNNIGYYGPISTTATDASDLVSVTINGTTENSITFSGMSDPSTAYGATSIVIYRSLENQTVAFAATFSPLGASTFVLSQPGLGIIPANFDSFGRDDFPSGLGTKLPFSDIFFPRFTELYNNQLFLAGILINEAFTGLDLNAYASNFFFSEIGIPESIPPENTLELRTNDGDVISGMKAYNGGLVVSKYKSLHVLSGTDPTTFLLQQITDQYGCLSNRAMVGFNNTLWMLDSKGIVEYNGANTKIISSKMDPVFARMNISAARDQAFGIFYKEINQVWFGFPVDGSTKNNMIVVYDILVGAWTKYEGLDLNSVTIAEGTLDKPHVVWGGYSGAILNFGASYSSDYGTSGIVTLFQTPFYAPTGQTVERQFRRFYLNVDPVLGSSTPIRMAFYPDFGATAGHTTVIYQAPFQTRVDFGVPAKSLSAVGTFVSATFSIKVNGYTFESRYQRNV